VFGGLLQFLVVALALRPARLLQPSFDFASGPVRRLIRLSLPVCLGDTGDKVNLIVTRAFASLPVGAVSGLQYAYTVEDPPHARRSAHHRLLPSSRAVSRRTSAGRAHLGRAL
jgi:peptidoglycan biosynthesis protein MviN/MurJ (putative lipid II flippase)